MDVDEVGEEAKKVLIIKLWLTSDSSLWIAIFQICTAQHSTVRVYSELITSACTAMRYRAVGEAAKPIRLRLKPPR